MSAPSVFEQLAELKRSAAGLVDRHIDQFATALSALAEVSSQVAAGGEDYPVGVRELARRVADETVATHNTLSAIRGRLK